MASSPPTARQLARRLIETEQTRAGAPDSAEAAALNACAGLYRELCRLVGGMGCHALFTRSLRTAQIDHPVLAEVIIHPNEQPRLDGIEQVVALHGPAAAAVALEALLVDLIGLLERFIGDDVVAALAERSTVSPAEDETAKNGRTENGEG